MADSPRFDALPAGHRLGRYTVVRPLGKGGMGAVYVALDERLGREVALKLFDELNEEATRERFWREARAAASVTHPNICQVYEIEETSEGIHLAMELLVGEPLDVRLARGAMPPAEATRAALEMLAALGALHARGLVHRDIKPSNVFCTPHGMKVLDFGLARASAMAVADADSAAAPQVTRTGLIMGTPRYMAPEQLTGEALDHRTDLYATGAVLFEMLAGRPPFAGASPLDQMYATMHEHPPALQGPPFVVAIDRVIRRALEKQARDRWNDAAAMARELADIVVTSGPALAIPVRALTRLVVPPFRLLRPDADANFLSFGLADAMSGSLATLGDIVVRSPSVAAAWSDPGADPRKLATQADVDLVLAGSVMRSGNQLRATIQLIEAGTGTVLGASTANGTMDDIFALEDALTQSALQLLAPRRSQASGEALVARRDVPANGRAFELFLRGTELVNSLQQAPAARALFREAVEADPLFAPAWAALGRCHRVVGKYFEARVENERRAEEAFRRALALSPDLPMAHRWLTHLEAEQGRAELAVARLLGHAKVNRNDAQLFAGLVHALRYAGLPEASLAAHAEARRLDPTVPTSVEYSLMMMGEEARLFDLVQANDGEIHRDALIALLALCGADARLEAIHRTLDPAAQPHRYMVTLEAVYASAFRTPAEGRAALEACVAGYSDPEAYFLAVCGFVRLGEIERAMALLAEVMQGGFVPVRMVAEHPLFAPVRAHAAYPALEADGRRRVAMARAIFERGKGAELLGL